MNILMYDLARENSWVSDHWRRILPEFKRFGYTDIGLYVEQRYHFRSQPLHRPLGGLTPAQAAEARRLCRHHGLGLIWFVNTLGHNDGLLANENYRYLAEDPGELHQLCPSHPDTRPLLRQMLGEFAALSPHPVLHIGGDEARALNRCPRCQRRGLTDGQLYLDHYRWVIRETKRLGKRPALWGDMLLRHPAITTEIDRDTLIFDWHYEGGSADTIRFFQQLGFEVVPTTSTLEFWVPFHPFGQTARAIAPLMRDARQLRCTSICQTVWELYKSAMVDNLWELLAAAPALFAGRPVANFARDFYGTAAADWNRLRPLLDQKLVREIHPSFIVSWVRREFFRHPSPFPFYQLYRSPRARAAWNRLGRRLAAARRVAAAIQRAARKRREYLRDLDLPIELWQVMHDRLETLCLLRETLDRLYPHRAPAAAGARQLHAAARRLARHVDGCRSLRDRFELARQTRGHSSVDVHQLNRQIGELEQVLRYVRHHARSYRHGEPVPTPELWWV